ncbi:MAG: N-acetylneuraminate synthase [Bacteroidetes bacterium]|nr:N-acetylneuraminate synthase [Bacteroidota bacterium]
MDNKVLVIAEAGVNHNGDITNAKEMVKVAALAGADYVKFQTFNAELLANPKAKKASYQTKNSNEGTSQFEMLKQLQLSKADHVELIKHCEQQGIGFLSSPFDMESINLLVDLKVEMIKIPSGEITNLPFLEKIGTLNKHIILSSGMADLEEVATAFDILTACGTSADKIVILHCTSQYPTTFNNVHLLAMHEIRDKIHRQVGFSDHTLGDEASIAAVALGAKVIEKHFTLDKNMIGPDHNFSLDPKELKEMIRKIRNIESALGKRIKTPNKEELKNMPFVRKSIHFNEDLPKGTTLSEKHIVMQRPGTGISPMEIGSVIGQKTKKDSNRFDLISHDDIE